MIKISILKEKSVLTKTSILTKMSILTKNINVETLHLLRHLGARVDQLKVAQDEDQEQKGRWKITALSLSWECKLWTVSFDQSKIREFVFSPPLQRWRVQCPSGDQSQLRHEHVPAFLIFQQHLLSSMLCWLIELVSRWGGVGQWEDLSGWKGQNPLRNPSWGKGSFLSTLFRSSFRCSIEPVLRIFFKHHKDGFNKDLAKGHPVLYACRRLDIVFTLPLETLAMSAMSSHSISIEREKDSLGRFANRLPV